MRSKALFALVYESDCGYVLSDGIECLSLSCSLALQHPLPLPLPLSLSPLTLYLSDSLSRTTEHAGAKIPCDLILRDGDPGKCIEAIAQLQYWFHNPFPVFDQLQLGDDLLTFVMVFDFEKEAPPAGARFQDLEPLMDGRLHKTIPSVRLLDIPAWSDEQRADVTKWLLDPKMAPFFDMRTPWSTKFPLKGHCQLGASKQLLRIAPPPIRAVHDRVIAQFEGQPVHFQVHLTLLGHGGAPSHHPHADPFTNLDRAVVAREMIASKEETAKFRANVLACSGQVLIPMAFKNTNKK